MSLAGWLDLDFYSSSHHILLTSLTRSLISSNPDRSSQQADCWCYCCCCWGSLNTIKLKRKVSNLKLIIFHYPHTFSIVFPSRSSVSSQPGQPTSRPSVRPSVRRHQPTMPCHPTSVASILWGKANEMIIIYYFPSPLDYFFLSNHSFQYKKNSQTSCQPVKDSYFIRCTVHFSSARLV